MISLTPLIVWLLFPSYVNLGFSDNSKSVLQQAQKSLANQNKSFSADYEGSASKVTKANNGFSTYENTDYRVSIMFPQSWKLSEVSLPPYGIAIFNAPEATQSPTSVENYIYTPAALLLASQKLPVNNMTMDEYIESLFKEVYENSTQYRLFNSVKSSLGGMESRKIIMYEYWHEGTFKILRNIAIEPNTHIVYMIKYSADPGMFSRYLPTVYQMMNSFKLR